jgi:hypothetical protein
MREGVIHDRQDANAESVRRQLVREGWRVFDLPTGIVDERSLFEAVRRSLPLDPPLGRFRDVWDAMSDSIFGGLAALDAERVAVIWPNAAQMAEQSPDEFSIAKEVLADAANALSAIDQSPTALLVVLVR